MEAGRNLNAPASIIHWLEPRRGFVKQVAHGVVHQWSVMVRLTTALRNGPYGIFWYLFRKFPWKFLIPSVLICLFSAPCNNPGIPKGGKRIDNNFRHGKHVRFSCPRNRKMIGPRKITCYNGHWGNKRPQCLRRSQIKGKENYLWISLMQLIGGSLNSKQKFGSFPLRICTRYYGCTLEVWKVLNVTYKSQSSKLHLCKYIVLQKMHLG